LALVLDYRKSLLTSSTTGPNKEFVTGRLLSWTLSNTDIRMTLEVGIAYGSDVEQRGFLLSDLPDSETPLPGSA
jgi:hypothetical protein